MTREGPLFNLKAVVQQTGLKPDTLRAWERRYGIPSPARSGGRQRLYTRRDIETLRWLDTRRQEGLSIGRAVDLWRQIGAGGRDPLLAMALVSPSRHAAAESREGSALAHLREEWLEACLVYDERRVEAAAAQALALYPPETVGLELLQWALREVGALWQRGAATIQQEHYASELAMRRLESLLSATPPATRPGRILAACPPAEFHTFGLLLLTLLLRRRGWSVVFLGAAVPVDRLGAAITTIGPDLVILSAQRLPSAVALLAQVEALHGRAPVGYGGGVFNAFPAIRSRIPGHFLGESVEVAAGAVESLLSAPRPVPAGAPAPAEACVALEHFRERRGAIEAELGHAAGAASLSWSHLAHANEELASHLEAALVLGDLALLDPDIGGVEQMLTQPDIPAGLSGRYLQAYRLAVEGQLDERGEPIRAWLRRVTSPDGRAAPSSAR